MNPCIVLDLGAYSANPYDMSGIALRAIELAEALAGEFQVRIFAPSSKESGRSFPVDIKIDPTSWPALLAEAFVVMFFDMPDLLRLEETARSKVMLVSENAPPIEQLEYPRFLGSPDSNVNYQHLVFAYRRQVELSHHFLCRSKIERAVLLGNLCLAGRLKPSDVAISRTVDHLVTTVPIGFSRKSAQRAATVHEKPVADFLWTGGLWAFYNPEMLIRAIHICHARGCLVSLAFLYGTEVPDNALTLRRLKGLIAEFNLEDHVHLLTAPLAHDERDSLLKGAKAQICIGLPGIENETCVRLRIRDSRLYGLPMVVDRYGASAAEVQADGLGVVLEDDRPEALAELLMRLMKQRAHGPLQRYCYDDTLAAFKHWVRSQW